MFLPFFGSIITKEREVTEIRVKATENQSSQTAAAFSQWINELK